MAGRCGSGESLTRTRCESREAQALLAYAGLCSALPGVGTLTWATPSRRPVSIFVSTRARAPHAYFAAPVGGRRAV
jgi:hypothetical protein